MINDFRSLYDLKTIFMILKTAITRPLCLLASFAFCGGYEGYHLIPYGQKYINTVCITVKILEPNILDLRLPINCDISGSYLNKVSYDSHEN